MKKSEKQIITFLKLKGVMTASDLSYALNVSTRQIRYYIKSIKTSYPNLLLSSRLGYKINENELISTNLLNQKEVERTDIIIQKLLLSKDGCDYFEIADNLFISETTLDKDIEIIKDKIKKESLTLTRSKGILRVEGSEKNKRKLVAQMMNELSNSGLITQKSVSVFFTEYPYHKILKETKEILDKHNIYVNDYALNNIMIHLIVTIERIRSNYTIDIIYTPNYKIENEYLHATNQIADFIQKEFNIVIDKNEKSSISKMIYNSSTLVHIKDTQKNIMIDSDIYECTKKILRKAEEIYHLDSFDEVFINNLSLHIEVLKKRILADQVLSNINSPTIKNSYPLIYDIAVFISYELSLLWGKSMDEAEIAFIAFHIGAYFENNQINKRKINAIYIYADYNNFQKNSLSKLAVRFTDTLNLKYAISYHNYDSSVHHADFVIAAVDIPLQTPHVFVSLFLKEADYLKIGNKITELLNSEKALVVKEYLLECFNSKLFYINPTFNCKEALIKMICLDAESLGFTGEGLFEDIIQREVHSSTEFSSIAIPHALSFKCNSNFIAVALFNPKVKWNKNEINICMLLGIGKRREKSFSELLDSLIDIVDEPKFSQELSIQTSYEDFISKICALIDSSYLNNY